MLAKQRKEREEKEKEEREKEARAREVREKEAKERAAKDKEKKDRETREKEAMERLKESREREARENSLGGRRREAGEASGSFSRIANLRKEVNDDEEQRSGSRRRFDPENSSRRQMRGNQVEPELVEVSVKSPTSSTLYLFSTWYFTSTLCFTHPPPLCTSNQP